MPRSKNNYNNKHSKKHRTRRRKHFIDWNFVQDAGPGCHVARRDVEPDWTIEWETINPADYDDEEVPDIAFDPESQTITVCNLLQEPVVAYITIYEAKLYNRNHELLEQGVSVNNNGEKVNCTTLIVLCPEHTFAHLCYVVLEGMSSNSPGELPALHLESDVQVWNYHPSPDDTHSQSVGFPLQGDSFLCTQGEGGVLTHFFSGNYHAIDFRCPVGTPLLAVANGIVRHVQTESQLTGIAVSNLFQWNSILLELDEVTENAKCPDAAAKSGPLFVEYVHIDSATVTVGDRVQEGQVLGTSGSVGFSPEPHLHFAAYRTADDTAATVRIYFHGKENRTNFFLPKAGLSYNHNGQIESKS